MHIWQFHGVSRAVGATARPGPTDVPERRLIGNEPWDGLWLDLCNDEVMHGPNLKRARNIVPGRCSPGAGLEAMRGRRVGARHPHSSTMFIRSNDRLIPGTDRQV